MPNLNLGTKLWLSKITKLERFISHYNLLYNYFIFLVFDNNTLFYYIRHIANIMFWYENQNGSTKVHNYKVAFTCTSILI